MSRFHRVSLSFLVPAVLWLLSVIPVHGTDEAYVIGAADVLEIQKTRLRYSANIDG